MEESPEITWAELREKLETEYAGEPSALEAMGSLAELKQKEGETLVELGERIKRLSLLAFPQENIRLTAVLQAHLVDCYIDALQDDEIKKEILKAEPEDVARAVHLARRNQNFMERVRKRRQGQDKSQNNRERVSRLRRNPKPVSGRRRLEDWSAEGGMVGWCGVGFMIPSISTQGWCVGCVIGKATMWQGALQGMTQRREGERDLQGEWGSPLQLSPLLHQGIRETPKGHLRGSKREGGPM